MGSDSTSTLRTQCSRISQNDGGSTQWDQAALQPCAHNAVGSVRTVEDQRKGIRQRFTPAHCTATAWGGVCTHREGVEGGTSFLRFDKHSRQGNMSVQKQALLQSIGRRALTRVRRVPSMLCPGRAAAWIGTTTQLSSPMARHMSSAVLASASSACLCSPTSGMGWLFASYALPSCRNKKSRINCLAHHGSLP